MCLWLCTTPQHATPWLYHNIITALQTHKTYTVRFFLFVCHPFSSTLWSVSCLIVSTMSIRRDNANIMVRHYTGIVAAIYHIILVCWFVWMWTVLSNMWTWPSNAARVLSGETRHTVDWAGRHQVQRRRWRETARSTGLCQRRRLQSSLAHWPVQPGVIFMSICWPCSY